MVTDTSTAGAKTAGSAPQLAPRGPLSPTASKGCPNLQTRNQAHINDNPLMPAIVNGKARFDLDNGKYLKIWQGPQHPGITGNMSLELVVCGDEIVECKTHVGYLHRGFEKLMEPERAQQAIEKYQLELYNHQTAYFQEDKYVEKAFKLRKS